MPLSLPVPEASYSRESQAKRDVELKQADALNYKRNQDIELQPKQKLIVRSPNGHRWSISVTDAGDFTATEL